MEKAYYTSKGGKTYPEIDGAVSGTGTILLADDDFFIRMTSERLLEGLGYTVLAACDGIEAINMYRAQQNEIDLVILDLVMPVMRGDETYLKLKEIDPDCKVILMSGVIKEHELQELFDSGAKGFINKPFDVVAMSILIQKVVTEKV